MRKETFAKRLANLVGEPVLVSEYVAGTGSRYLDVCLASLDGWLGCVACGGGGCVRVRVADHGDHRSRGGAGNFDGWLVGLS